MKKGNKFKSIPVQRKWNVFDALNRSSGDFLQGYQSAMSKVDNDEPLQVKDLEEIKKVAEYARDTMGWRIVHLKTRQAVKEACERLGVKTSTIIFDYL